MRFFVTILMVTTLCSIHSYGQENFKVMFYNLLEFPDAPPENRPELLKTIVEDISPDLFMVCELKSETGAETILNESLTTSDNRYRMANYVVNQSSGANLQQLVYYDGTKFELEAQKEIITSVRDINRYTFKIKNTDIYIEAFVTHLKASQGFTNEQLRLDMVREFTLELARVPNGRYVIFAGDFNFYTSNEDGYQELLDETNAIQLKDPLNRNGNWHTNSSFSDIHTQSTRISSSGFDGFGAGGGLDDRFDFIMLSDNLFEDSILSYEEDSYETFGNNGNCYNLNLTDSRCTGPYSQAMRTTLYNMSDHLPVTLELRYDQTLSISNINSNQSLISLSQGNLVKDNLIIKIDPQLLSQTLIIYNSLGQEIKKVNIVSSMIDSETNLDATDLALGIYYISVTNSTSPYPIKFIKVN